MAVATTKGEKKMSELAQEFDVHPNQINLRCDQLLEGATDAFGEAPVAEPEPTIDVKALHAKIGELKLEYYLCPVRTAKLVCCTRMRRDLE